MKILLTGGAGYIGSHTAVELLEAGYDVVIADNLEHSSADVIDKFEQITDKRPSFYNADTTSYEQMCDIFAEEKDISAVIHLAGFKYVNDAVKSPLKYYKNNIQGMVSLLEAMDKFGVYNLVLSSSANVYGESKEVPVKEGAATGECTNPYGRTKWMQEQILKDIYISDNRWSFVILRYFNPAGAHESGLIGENYEENPSNLFPFIALVADGKKPFVNIYGNTYNTIDGTGVRDYIHISDLANGHVKVLSELGQFKGVKTYNLGTGKGYSVLEAIHAFERVCGHKIPYVIKDRRDGDIAEMYACCDKVYNELGWKAKRSLNEICESSWNWQQKQNN